MDLMYKFVILISWPYFLMFLVIFVPENILLQHKPCVLQGSDVGELLLIFLLYEEEAEVCR